MFRVPFSADARTATFRRTDAGSQKSSRDPRAATIVPRADRSHRTVTGDRPQRLHWCAHELRAPPQRLRAPGPSVGAATFTEHHALEVSARSAIGHLCLLWASGRRPIATAVPDPDLREISRTAISRARQPTRGRRGAGAAGPVESRPLSSCPLGSASLGALAVTSLVSAFRQLLVLRADRSGARAARLRAARRRTKLKSAHLRRLQTAREPLRRPAAEPGPLSLQAGGGPTTERLQDDVARARHGFGFDHGTSIFSTTLLDHRLGSRSVFASFPPVLRGRLSRSDPGCAMPKSLRLDFRSRACRNGPR